MRRIVAALVGCVGLLGAGLTAPAHSAEPLPVSYNFLGGAVAAGLSPATDAPGTNDWSCKPSAAHPRPVILVHGTAGNKETNWQAYGPLLKNNGYCVFALTYGALPVPGGDLLAGLGDIRASAQQLKEFTAQVLAATGARQVDLIGHSQGTLMPQYWIKNLGGAGSVKNYVSLAPVWHGTLLTFPVRAIASAVGSDTVPPCYACAQMAPGSALIKQLHEGGLATPGVQYTNIVSRFDEIVVPYTSGLVPGMTNVVIQRQCGLDFSDHLAIAADPVAAQVVLNTLDPHRKLPVRCQLVLPAIGA